MGESMKAMSYRRYGGLEVLENTPLPRPRLAPGSVLIRVKAAGVNPVDWSLMAGNLDGLMDVRFPVVPGWDVAGVVEAVGFDTPEFQPGDEVYSYGRRDTVQVGTFAEFAVVPAPIVAHKPPSLSWEQAGGLPLAGLTALRCIDFLELTVDDTVLIHNGAGGVGRAGIQLAKRAGARVIATASEKNHARLRELGAEPVTYGEGLADRVRALSPQVDAVADFAGGVLEATLALLKPGGRQVSIADRTVGEHGGRYVWVRPDAVRLDRLSAMVEDGSLVVDVAASYPMQELAQAFEASMTRHGGGKIVMTEFTD